VRKGLTKDWSIDFDTDYASRVVDVSLQFIAPGRTIWIAVWGPPTDQSPEDTLRGIKGELPNPNPDGKVEEWSDDRLEVRYANWYSEPGTPQIRP
jgi:hypothetical protein